MHPLLNKIAYREDWTGFRRITICGNCKSINVWSVENEAHARWLNVNEKVCPVCGDCGHFTDVIAKVRRLLPRWPFSRGLDVRYPEFQLVDAEHTHRQETE